MSYRDDVDTLYTRAMILQRELDAAKDTLAARDEELAKLRGTPIGREDTSPGMRALRELPDPDVVLARLADVVNREARAPAGPPPLVPGLPRLRAPLPMPTWFSISTDSLDERDFPKSALVEHVREGVGRLTHDDLVLVAKIVEQFTDGHAGMDEQLRARLRWLASEIALVEK